MTHPTILRQSARAIIPLTSLEAQFQLPAGTTVLEPRRLEPIVDVPRAIAAALAQPQGTAPLTDIVRRKLGEHPDGSAVIVISDNTRPVPYTGPTGILWPLVEKLLSAGLPPGNITILIASGTHRQLADDEIGTMLDERVMRSGARVRCHDAFDPTGLVPAGRTSAGLEVMMNREYIEADLRLLTGLVESHLMAGASGGRKSICPGLLGIDSIRDFHGPAVLADPLATDLVTAGNPCHELSLEIARMAPPDLILNVTAREDGAVMGVFAGDMEQAHEEAVAHLRCFAEVPFGRRFDIVVSHGGKVGVNHYQAAKAAAVASRVVKSGGHIILLADTVDPDPIGSVHYRGLIALLRDLGQEAFERLILSPDWTFTPDQWQVQMWGRVFKRIPPGHLFYFSPQTPLSEYGRLPCRSPEDFWEHLAPLAPREQMEAFVEQALRLATKKVISDGAGTGTKVGRTIESDAARGGPTPTVAFLPAGPYGIPVEPRCEG